MKYAVYSVHRWSGVKSDPDTVEARSPRVAAFEFAKRFGSLGMLNYVHRTGTSPEGAALFEVMGTSGVVFDVTVCREAQA